MIRRFFFLVVVSLFSICAFSQGKSVPQNLRTSAQRSVSMDKTTIQKKTQAQQKPATTQQPTKQQVQNQGQYVPRARQITVWQACFTCAGSRQCQQCFGQGTTFVDYGSHTGYITCGACNGTRVCQVCHGAGGQNVYETVYE